MLHIIEVCADLVLNSISPFQNILNAEPVLLFCWLSSLLRLYVWVFGTEWLQMLYLSLGVRSVSLQPKCKPEKMSLVHVILMLFLTEV